MVARKPPLNEHERHLRARAAALQFALNRARDKQRNVLEEMHEVREEFAALRAQRSEAS